ncbi:TetR/AcrR family transcriptional regulator [Clostridium saccharobutylicum]|uniref:Putative TetR family transcriptional regulator n=1 Tax=Clostridium saccharobutylicum DSM 13864 TaxID=1345695 RepID=U5MVD9_CLOSA|nr:TetR/AcrR family transcriptional regulator [Clostridium saccharobutylicum]AGX44493.1 putative TetR family transcriptional regulator [Clostridium saccharobutylicum DSM 13864]AQR91787.1 HTH-type transcriptional regulator BetI [Clostridium saccharobutylicum]AQS01689.1 HTH-type transcriptional regulator BetI [Clostridium saccharobutylicum]AQS15672.1 HTH-type transcriptional regulator BetI [Clostridium saccharobutylicum]MBA2907449.1 AcrR family transcriptional regulator [Clostridium saccharobuty
MSKIKIREPRQARSIEKKRKIAQAGIKLFREKGFHHTNTNEIAKEAGVSTGIVYHYFQDKKAILLAAIDEIIPKFDVKILEELHLSKDKKILQGFLSDIIDKVVQFHKTFKSCHEEFEAMRHSDPDVGKHMNQFKDNLLCKIADTLPALGFDISNPHEKLDMIYDMIDHYCHSVVVHKRDKVNYDDMKILIVKNILILSDLDAQFFE